MSMEHPVLRRASIVLAAIVMCWAIALFFPFPGRNLLAHQVLLVPIWILALAEAIYLAHIARRWRAGVVLAAVLTVTAGLSAYACAGWRGAAMGATAVAAWSTWTVAWSYSRSVLLWPARPTSRWWLCIPAALVPFSVFGLYVVAFAVSVWNDRVLTPVEVVVCAVIAITDLILVVWIDRAAKRVARRLVEVRPSPTDTTPAPEDTESRP